MNHRYISFSTIMYLIGMSVLMFVGFYLGIQSYKEVAVGALWLLAVVGLILYIPPVEKFLVKKMYMDYPVGQILAYDTVISVVLGLNGHWILATAFALATFRVYLPVYDGFFFKKKTK